MNRNEIGSTELGGNPSAKQSSGPERRDYTPKVRRLSIYEKAEEACMKKYPGIDVRILNFSKLLAMLFYRWIH